MELNFNRVNTPIVKRSKKMSSLKKNGKHWRWVIFGLFMLTGLLAGAVAGLVIPANAAPPAQTTEQPPLPSGAYAGSQACGNCHDEMHETWTSTRHAQAFSSPIFQRDWAELAKQTSCLQCHTTGFDAQSGAYAEEGVGCEACHGSFQPNHPAEQMPLEPDADLCARCHKNTSDEWQASPHSAAEVQCQACHNPHSQTPMADSITELCTNCHKERGDSFTHSTHANEGLECSNCHMYTKPREGDPIGGLVPTGHTFAVGSDACIGCHQETVHTRDELMKLGGEMPAPTPDVTALQQTIHDQEQELSSLETMSTVRLYTGLVQGAIIGLVTGGVAAWVVSRRIREVEVDENE
jgi:predicted CXXCH cytochrome family protein